MLDISQLIVTFVDLFAMIFYVLLLARVLMSYFVSPTNEFYGWIVNITEPLLVPIRKFVPQMPGVDLAPLIAFLILQVLQQVLHTYL